MTISGWYSTDINKKAYEKHGFEVISTEMFERSLKDFQPMLTKVIATKPDIIEIASVPPATTGLLVRQARELGYKGLFVKDAGAAVKEIVDAAGKEGSEGIISLHFADTHNEGFKRIVAEYKKAINQEPDDLLAIAYDGTRAMLRAIQKGGDINDTAKVSAALFNGTFPMKSVHGDEITIGNGEKGDPNQFMTTSYISVIKNGEPVMVGKIR